jgi:hypothetical protein
MRAASASRGWHNDAHACRPNSDVVISVLSGVAAGVSPKLLAEFEDLLCQAFADLAHRAVRTKGLRGLIVLWMRTLPDLISTAFSQRLQSRSDWRFRLRWVLACTAGRTGGSRMPIWMGSYRSRNPCVDPCAPGFMAETPTVYRNSTFL